MPPRKTASKSKKPAAPRKAAAKKPAAKKTAPKRAGFKLTYATMFDPPQELHTRFDAALAKLKSELGQEHGMIIDGKEVRAQDKFEDRSPINTDWVLGIFQKGTAHEAQAALAAARKSLPQVVAYPLPGARPPAAQGR